MPVPVPRQSKPPAHPVNKKCALGQTIYTQNLAGALPLGPPPSFGIREEWLSSLPSWRRNKQRLSFDETFLSAQPSDKQDFYLGLAAAGNASVIKGPHAEACLPPMNTLLDSHRVSQRNVDANYRYASQGDMDVEMNTAYAPFHQVRLDSNNFANRDGIDPMVQDQPLSFSTKPSPIQLLTDSSTLNRSYQSGVFTPIFEDQSPGSASGPEADSSPLEPLTPFGEYLDRAIAHAQQIGNDTQFTERSIVPDYCQEKQVNYDAYQPAPVFPSIADEPKQQDAVADTVIPITSTSYKKLSQPLSEWVANYVWKVCTTGFGLQPAFAQPSDTAGLYVVQVPGYLSSSIHYLLLSTLLQPSVVFLAVWYIVRLPVYFGSGPLGEEFAKETIFRQTLLGDEHPLNHDLAANCPAFRLVVLGCMLANKWLDDHTFSNKTWHSITNIPVKNLNILESLVLDMFAFDLSVSNEEWSKWLSHVHSYHLSLSSPSYPQPISRPSSNPHSIIRRAIEELIQVPTYSDPTSNMPQPVFLGIEERLREKAEKEEAMAMEAEINLDEDGPLREEYLPKRRASKLQPITAQAADKRSASGVPLAKALPPPAKWSPAGDEPILRNSNRSSGHYVAVQAPRSLSDHPADSQPRDLVYNQNWNSAGYTQAKPQSGYTCDMPNVLAVNQNNYNSFTHIGPIGTFPHSRSLSLSFDQDALYQHNHMRSYSQSQHENKYGDHRMTDRQALQEIGAKWGNAPRYYFYSGLYVNIPTAGMQPAW